MRISCNKRVNKYKEVICYFYIGKSKRVDGKVKTDRKYLCRLSINDIFNRDYLSKARKMLMIKFSGKELEEIENKLNKYIQLRFLEDV